MRSNKKVLAGSFSIVSLWGSLAGGKTSDLLGRKWTLALAAIVFQLGGAIMAFAPYFTVLMIEGVLACVRIGFYSTPADCCYKEILIAGCGIQCFQRVTGIDATVYYSPAIF